jgi:phosphohistidine phosphatase
MLRLVLFRHAKSSWAHPELGDFERPLNARGRMDAPRMAAKLKPFLGEPFHVLSSPANRAAATARYAVTHWKLPDTAINYEASLYHASSDILWQIVLNLHDSVKTVVIFGHNEGLTELAESCSQSTIQHLPTAGIVVFDFACALWSDLKMEEAKLITFNYPKKV